MSNAVKPEAPWLYAGPGNALPRLSEGSPASEALGYVSRLRTASAGKAEALSTDRHRTPEGKRAAFTEHVLPLLGEGKRHTARLDELAAQVQADTEAMVREAEAGPSTSPQDRDERLALAQAFGRLSTEEKMRYLQDAHTGKDPSLRAALAYTPVLITGLGEDTRRHLREQITESRLDPAKRQALETRAREVAAVRRALEDHTRAAEDAADREALKRAQVASLRRSLMTDEAKSAYIKQHGLEAFQSLPS